jgi:hypothetical protein
MNRQVSPILSPFLSRPGPKIVERSPRSCSLPATFPNKIPLKLRLLFPPVSVTPIVTLRLVEVSAKGANYLISLVGGDGFEPPTFCVESSPVAKANRTRFIHASLP